ncbi:hypothetical protein NIES593_07995 [Hydrococcus rivularis NIES-593]|uniref:Uncharacterized protein n=1 Tax=Hydrococcus rivularis NIES-593 TaxID=1921803 RepID=A0A1U7HKI5_9CYAN|nr:hypothetical protein NIES593_07995 [Hydrococcus rivularis NIES-593]
MDFGFWRIWILVAVVLEINSSGVRRLRSADFGEAAARSRNRFRENGGFWMKGFWIGKPFLLLRLNCVNSSVAFLFQIGIITR